MARTHSTIDMVVAPGVKTLATPMRGQRGMSSSGMMPPPKTTTSVGAALAQQVHDPREQRHVGAREHGQADASASSWIGGLDDLLRRLVQPGVDDLHAGVAQRAGDDLGAAVVTVQTGLGDDDADAAGAGHVASQRASSGSVGEYAPMSDLLRLACAAARRRHAPAPSPLPGATRRAGRATSRRRPSPRGASAAGPVAAAWDFAVFGGSFGEDDATALVVAARTAVELGVPLVTLVRSGGTRLQEGMAALVGIPRARLALLDLAAAGLPHLSVADAPTTGGVWISVASAADLRVAVEGATVGFAGPRVVEAVTGVLPAKGSHTAASAYAAGLVDAVLPGEQVAAGSAACCRPGPVARGPAGAGRRDRGGQATAGWEQVRRARARTTGRRRAARRAC